MRTEFMNLPVAVLVDYEYDPGASFDTTEMGRFLAKTRFKALREKYQHLADSATALFSCANCRGIEAFRSCLQAFEALEGYDRVANPNGLSVGDLTRLGLFLTAHTARITELREELGGIMDYRQARPFGKAFLPSSYKQGLRCENKPVKVFGETWYTALKDLVDMKGKKAAANRKLNELLPVGVGQAVTKQSAHAHSVIARASLEVGIRFGFLEFLTYASANQTSQVRPARAVAAQAVSLVDPVAQVSAAVLQEIEWLKRLWNGQEAHLGWDTDAKFAVGLMGRLTAKLGEVVSGAGQHKRANCFALCSLYRAVLLAKALPAFKAVGLNRARIRDSLGATRELFRYHPKTKPGNTSPFVHLAEFRGELRKGLTGLPKHIDDKGKNWATVREVEFAKQCGECEVEQGAFDLAGRFVESRVEHGRAVLDPKVGAIFSKLEASPRAGVTPWDVTAAVACEAVNLILRDLHKLAAQQGGAKPELVEMMKVYDAAVPLFVAYMETLFLGMGFEGTTRLPKVLEEQHDRSEFERRVVVVARPPVDIGARFSGPSSVEMNLAARVLGFSLRELLEHDDALAELARNYRRRAREAHPDRGTGDAEAFKELGKARDMLDAYLRGEKAPSGTRSIVDNM